MRRVVKVVVFLSVILMTYGATGGSWEQIGPAPINIGAECSNCPTGHQRYSGRVSAVALDPADPNMVIIGASKGGLWRTTDAGATWASVSGELPSPAIADISWSQSDPNIVYAASGDDDANAGMGWWGMGVFKSIDAGVTWCRVDDGTIPDRTVLSKIIVNALTPDYVVASGYVRYTGSGRSESAIFYSTDGGASFSQSSTSRGTASVRSLTGEAGCFTNLWAVDVPLGQPGNIIRSTDFGATWTAVTTTGMPSFTGNTKITALSSACSGNTMLYASVLLTDYSYAGVYVSTDSGETWSLSDPIDSGPDNGCYRRCESDHELLVDPGDPNRVYFTGRDLWVTTDGGVTWSNKTNTYSDSGLSYLGGKIHTDLHGVALSGSGPTAELWIASNGGIYTADTASWTFSDRNGDGLAITEVNGFDVSPDDPSLVIAGSQDSGVQVRRDSSSLTWEESISSEFAGSVNFVRLIEGVKEPFDGIVAAQNFGGTWRSTNRASPVDPWGPSPVALFTNGSQFFPDQASSFYPWHQVTDNRLWVGNQSLWYCDNLDPACSSAFSVYGPPQLSVGLAGDYSVISRFAIGNPDIGVYGPFYVAVVDASKNTTVYYSYDGTSWADRTVGLPARSISQIVIDPLNGDHAWVTLSGFGTGHVFETWDDGIDWTDISGDLPDVPANTFLVDPAGATTLYIGTDVGVWYSMNSGGSWMPYGTGMPASVITRLRVSSDGYLWVSTGGNSIWRTSFAGIATTCALWRAIGPSVDAYSTPCGLGDIRIDGSSTVADLLSGVPAETTDDATGPPGTFQLYQLECVCNGTTMLIKNGATGKVQAQF